MHNVFFKLNDFWSMKAFY